MIRDRGSNIWVGTASGGLLRVNAAGVSLLAARDGRPRGAVTALFEDRDGNLWVGSARGIERVRDSAFMTYSTRAGPAVGQQRADSRRARTAHVVRAVRRRRLLVAWTDRSSRDRPAAGLATDVVYSIAGGATRCVDRPAARRAHPPPRAGGRGPRRPTPRRDGLAQNSVYAVHESRDGAVWAGTLSGGVSRFKGGQFTTFTTADGLASNTIASIAEGRRRDDVVRHAERRERALAHGRWRSYSTTDGLPSNDVASLIVDSAGVVWVGTAERSRRSSSGGRVAVPQNGPDVLRGIGRGLAADERGSIWIATSNRVLRVARDKLLRGELGDADVREYGLPDGLHSVEGVRRHRCVVADPAAGCGSRSAAGLSMTDPARAGGRIGCRRSRTSSRCRPTASRRSARRVRVPAGRQRLTFTYAGLSLSVPERVRFRYRLDGFDGDWSEPVAPATTVYTNLGPGPYRFRVMASNGDGRVEQRRSRRRSSRSPHVSGRRHGFSSAGVVAIVLGIGGPVPPAHAPGRAAAQRPLRGTAGGADAHRAGSARHAAAGIRQRVDAAARRGRPRAGRFAGEASLDRVLELMGRVIDEGRNAVRGLRSPAAAATTSSRRSAGMQQELGGRGHVDFRVIVEGRPGRCIRSSATRSIASAARRSSTRSATRARQKIEIEIEYAAGARAPPRPRRRARHRRAGARSGRDGHWGLSGMRERAERIGARLKVWSRAGAGTEIELVVPGHVAFQPIVGASASQSGERQAHERDRAASVSSASTTTRCCAKASPRSSTTSPT